MRITKTGVILNAIYVAIFLICVVWAQFISDPKGNYVVLQVPVIIQHALLLVFNATHLLAGKSWITLYIILCPPMMILLGLMGGIIDYFISKLSGADVALNKSKQQGPSGETR